MFDHVKVLISIPPMQLVLQIVGRIRGGKCSLGSEDDF